MESQNILVTEGARFIGANLVNELRSRGHKVTALDLYNTDRDEYIRADV
jgi:dTDP-glucose 4,6-dehydratase